MEIIMKAQFISVFTDEQIQALALMADTVWHEWFPIILTDDQINYMVDKFQSFRAIKEQIEKGYEYYFININGTNAGYVGIHVEENTRKMFVSKVYLLKSFRGNGYASEAFEFLEGMALGLQLESMYLTVNKNNQHAIDVYLKKGFKNIRSEVTDIGSGYVMDDYVMEKTISI